MGRGYACAHTKSGRFNVPVIQNLSQNFFGEKLRPNGFEFYFAGMTGKEIRGKSEVKIMRSDRDQFLALKDFLQGITLKEIAEKYQVKFRTVRNWHERGHWAAQRRELEARVKSSIIERVSQIVLENTEQHLKLSFLCCRIVLEAVNTAYKSPEDKANYGLLDLVERVVRIGNLTALIQKNVMPMAQEEVIQKLVEDLENLKAGLKSNEVV